MSSKRAMKQAQKQAYAKHRSNIINNRFKVEKKNLIKNKDKNKILKKHVIKESHETSTKTSFCKT